MAKHTISCAQVRTFTSKDGVSLRKLVKNGYLTVSATVIDAIDKGQISHFEWDDEQGIETMVGANRDIKTNRFELMPVDSPKAKFSRLAGSDNVRVTNFEQMKEAAALVVSASF